MAEEQKNEEAAGEEDGEAPKKKKLSGKTLTLFVGGPVVLIGIIVGALFFLGILGGGSHEEAEGHGEHGEEHAEAEEAHMDPSKLVFYEIPEIVTNLKTDGKGSSFLKLSVSLELDKSVKIEQLEPLMPRIIDQFQVYLRELRLDDLSGSAGMFRLKEELLRRVNLAADPIEVHDVLFKEMIVQ